MSKTYLYRGTVRIATSMIQVTAAAESNSHSNNAGTAHKYPSTGTLNVTLPDNVNNVRMYLEYTTSLWSLFPTQSTYVQQSLDEDWRLYVPSWDTHLAYLKPNGIEYGTEGYPTIMYVSSSRQIKLASSGANLFYPYISHNCPYGERLVCEFW